MRDTFNALVAAIEGEGAVLEVIAPKIAGVMLSDKTAVAAQQKIDGGPSVLYDAVAVLASEDGAALLAARRRGEEFRHGRFRPLQIHRLQRRCRAAVRQSRDLGRSR